MNRSRRTYGWRAPGQHWLVVIPPYLWLLLLTMPIFGSFIEQEKRNVQRLIIAFLDELAKQQQMTKLPFGRPADSAAKTPPAKTVPAAR